MINDSQVETKRLIAFKGARELSKEEINWVSGGRMHKECSVKGSWSEETGSDVEIKCTWSW